MRQVRICAVALLGVLAIAGVAGAASTNRIVITAPAYIVHSQKSAYAFTLSGYSRRRGIAYLFLDYEGCLRSVAAERQRVDNENGAANPKPYEYYGVRGSFTEVSDWKSSSAGTDHACAYLISRASGTLLTAARMSFVVH